MTHDREEIIAHASGRESAGAIPETPVIASERTAR
jgi:hypothetical protein